MGFSPVAASDHIILSAEKQNELRFRELKYNRNEVDSNEKKAPDFRGRDSTVAKYIKLSGTPKPVKQALRRMANK